MATAHHRRLANVLLRYLDTQDQALPNGSSRESQNMTDSTAAPRCLVNHPNTHRAEAWTGSTTNGRTNPGSSTDGSRYKRDLRPRHNRLGFGPTSSVFAQNPNRFRALVRAFSTGNPTAFHRADGAGYAFIADEVLTIDRATPRWLHGLFRRLPSWAVMTTPAKPSSVLKSSASLTLPVCQKTPRNCQPHLE